MAQNIFLPRTQISAYVWSKTKAKSKVATPQYSICSVRNYVIYVVIPIWSRYYPDIPSGKHIIEWLFSPPFSQNVYRIGILSSKSKYLYHTISSKSDPSESSIYFSMTVLLLLSYSMCLFLEQHFHDGVYLGILKKKVQRFVHPWFRIFMPRPVTLFHFLCLFS